MYYDDLYQDPERSNVFLIYIETMNSVINISLLNTIKCETSIVIWSDDLRESKECYTGLSEQSRQLT